MVTSQYINIYICIYIYIEAYIQKYIYIYMYVCMYDMPHGGLVYWYAHHQTAYNIHLWLYIYIHIYMYPGINMYGCTQTHCFVSMVTCIRRYISVCTHFYATPVSLSLSLAISLMIILYMCTCVCIFVSMYLFPRYNVHCSLATKTTGGVPWPGALVLALKAESMSLFNLGYSCYATPSCGITVYPT